MYAKLLQTVKSYLSLPDECLLCRHDVESSRVANRPRHTVDSSRSRTPYLAGAPVMLLTLIHLTWSLFFSLSVDLTSFALRWQPLSSDPLSVTDVVRLRRIHVRASYFRATAHACYLLHSCAPCFVCYGLSPTSYNHTPPWSIDQKSKPKINTHNFQSHSMYTYLQLPSLTKGSDDYKIHSLIHPSLINIMHLNENYMK